MLTKPVNNTTMFTIGGRTLQLHDNDDIPSKLLIMVIQTMLHQSVQVTEFECADCVISLTSDYLHLVIGVPCDYDDNAWEHIDCEIDMKEFARELHTDIITYFDDWVHWGLSYVNEYIIRLREDNLLSLLKLLNKTIKEY